MKNFLSSYTSLIELLTAFNFAYVSSEGLRKIVNNSGILYKIRQFEEKINKLNNELESIENNNFNSFILIKKIMIKKNLYNLQVEINNISKKLIEEIDKRQTTIVIDYQNSFILTGIYGIFWLFLAGQENYPVTSLIGLILGILTFLFISVFFKKTYYLIILFVFWSFIISKNDLLSIDKDVFDEILLFIPNETWHIFLLYFSLILSFIPFLLIYTYFTYLNIKLKNANRERFDNWINQIIAYQLSIDLLKEYENTKL